MPKKAHQVCILNPRGCHLNKLDTERIRKFFSDNGWIETDDLKKAGMIVYNSCAYTKGRIAGCKRDIRMINREKKRGAVLVVCGCLKRIDQHALLELHKGPSFDPLSLEGLDSLINAKKSLSRQSLCQRMIIDDEVSENRDIAFVRTNYGCVGRCSFCAVKNVFPELKSRSQEEIINEIKAAVRDGCRDIGLTSEDLTAYGLDIGTDIISLLRKAVALKGDFKISLYRVHPDYLVRKKHDFLEILGSGKVSFISIPVNSGSQRILRLMRRKYPIPDVKRFILLMRKRFPDLIIRLDIMVGFPTENEDDFKRTVDFVKACKSDIVFIYEFSPTPGTDAARMRGHLKKQVIRQRAKKLNFERLRLLLESKNL